MLVQESLSPETIEIIDRSDNAADVIARLSAKVSSVLGIEPDVVERATLDRERSRTTAFTNGAAIPHCRLPGLERFAVGLMILRQSVRWDNEGHAVDTVMLIAGPSDNVSDHLRILANSSQLLDSSALRAKLKSAPDAEAAYRLMEKAEEVVEQRRSREGMLRELRRDEHNGAAGDILAEVVAKFEW